MIELDNNDKVRFLKNVSNKTGLSQESIEKDWWMTMTIKALFSLPSSKSMILKGGASLSKCWNITERFSENIDIAIDRQFFNSFGVLNQNEFETLNRMLLYYTTNTIKSKLITSLETNKVPFTNVGIIEQNKQNPSTQLLYVEYQSIINSKSNKKNRVLIEIGTQSSMELSEIVHLKSIISNYYKRDNAICTIPTEIPTRTFLEKIFLLHEEFQKPENEIRHIGMARHLYDLEKMTDTQICTDALSNKCLYFQVVKHRNLFCQETQITEESHHNSKINIIPPDPLIELYRKDYKKMRHLIYGNRLTFTELMRRIKSLNKKINKL